MARPPWKPSPDERRRLTRIRRLVVRRDSAQREIDAELAALAEGGASAKALGEELRMDRKAVARHIASAAAHTATTEESP